MKARNANGLLAFVSGLLAFYCIFLFMEEAGATNYNKDPKAEADAAAQAQSSADSASTSQAEQSQTAAGGDSSSTASSSNDGVQVGGDSVENNSSNVVLVPNNNTESCLRVFGIAFGRDGSSGAIGFPWRSAKCDYEQAADDAFAAGERDLGWFWKCQNKNLFKRFRSKGETEESAIDDCHTRMLATTSTSDVVRKLEEQLSAAENMIELQERHKAVCDESLERCEEKHYGSK